MTTSTAPSTADRWQAGALTIPAAATAGYWTEYFTTGRVRSSDDPSYIAFENAFPLADAYMAACSLVAARGLWRGRSYAVPSGIAAGSAMVFLGAMDTLWNIQHRNYRDMTPQMAMETAINLSCLIGGPFTMWRVWRRRHALEHGSHQS